MLVLKQHHSYTLLEILEGEKGKKKKGNKKPTTFIFFQSQQDLAA